VIDFQVIQPRHQDFKDSPTKVVRYQQIWVDQVNFRDEGLNHLFLVHERLDARALAHFNLLCKIGWERHVAFKSSDQGKVLNALSRCSSILVNLVVNQARYHCNLIGVIC
jgi:hypothetical protein